MVGCEAEDIGPKADIRSAVAGGLQDIIAALLEAVAFAVHLEDVDVVGQTIQQGAG